MKLIISTILFITAILSAQDSYLEGYIFMGIQNNPVMKQKNIELELSVQDLKQAVSLFYPSVDIFTRYSRAEGGREINIPIGDLVNPIYGALNSITQSNAYPTDIANETVPFLREKEHDTKISLTQPLFYPEILFNYYLKDDLKQIEKQKQLIYARELILEIQKAYYNHIKAIKVIEIYHSAVQLLKENLRISESLYNNDKVTVDAVYYSEAELLSVQDNLDEAIKDSSITKHYFNTLINRDSREEILLDSIDVKKFEINFDSLKSLSLSKREELNQIYKAIEANEEGISIAKSSFFPTLAFAFDYGYQGKDYNFGSDYNYWIASLVLKWNIFRGFKDDAEVEKYKLKVNKYKYAFQDAKNKIELDISDKIKNLNLRFTAVSTKGSLLKSRTEAYKIISRKYEENNVSQIEVINAQNNLTQSQISYELSKLDYLIAKAELMRATSLIDLSKYGLLENKENK